MATDNNILGLRAQIAANLKVRHPNLMGEIVTVQNKKGKWQAAFVQNSEVQWTDGIWYDATETALEGLLKLTSYELYQYLEFYKV